MGCVCPGWAGSLPYTRWGCRLVGRSLLWSEGWGFPRGLLQLGWVQGKVSGLAAPLLRFSTMLAFPCKAAYVPGVSRVNGELLALLVRSSAGTCQELGPLSCSSFQWCREKLSPIATHTQTMLPGPACHMVT